MFAGVLAWCNAFRNSHREEESVYRVTIVCAAVITACWLVQPLVEGQSGAAVEVWMRAFIPNPANAGQASAFIVAVPAPSIGSVVRLRGVDNAVLDLCFATDNRSFSNAAATTARLETRLTISPTSSSAATVTPAANRTSAAVTKKVNCLTGSVLEQAPGDVVRDHLGAPAVADGTIQVIGQAEGRNVLTPLGNSGPAIDYSFDLQWKPATSTLTAAITYGVFPAFEVYARKPGGAWVAVLQHKPSGPPWKLAGDAFGVTTERQVQTVLVP